MSVPDSIQFHRAVYLSGPNPACVPRDLLDACHAYPDRNTQSCIGGKLLCVGDQLIFLLEGPREALGGLIERLQDTVPEAGMKVHSQEPIETRVFTRWSLGDLYFDEVRRQDEAAAEELADLLIDLLSETTPPATQPLDGETPEGEEPDESEAPRDPFAGAVAILERYEVAHHNKRTTAA